MAWETHGFRAGASEEWFDASKIPGSVEELHAFAQRTRKRIEPWLAGVFQSEHLNVLLGSGFTTAIALLAGGHATGMAAVELGTENDDAIKAHARASAARMGRGAPNIEDQFRSALSLLEGLEILGPAKKTQHDALKAALDLQMRAFLKSLLETEKAILRGSAGETQLKASSHLQSFLLSFASRSASRERLHIFTTNYDRLIEHGCDLAGLRAIDRFVGALNPVFRSSRIEVDLHYNPPGIRGEPRFMEGVVRLTKLHGSLDWHLSKHDHRIRRQGIAFGTTDHPDIPSEPINTVMVYPNAVKDVETTAYPYAELFRDFAAALCRPNSSLVTYGYGFGDDHINRVLTDMLAIPSTHLVVIAFAADERLKNFCDRVSRQAQISLLVGPHFANIQNLTEYYLPKPSLDYISGRVTELLKRRPDQSDFDGVKPGQAKESEGEIK